MIEARKGWLDKRLPLGFRSRRYCSLVDNQLIVAKDENCENVDLIIKIQPSTKIEITDEKRFRVEEGADTVQLEATSVLEMMDWVQTLRGCCFTTCGMSMQQFKIIKILGRGYYGKVSLCQSKSSGKLYAIKSIHKASLVKENEVYTVINERNILLQSEHPFIVKMEFAFQTHSKFYLGLEYVPGGELFYHLKEKGIMSLDQVRLYTMEIALALQYLHENGIVYRDLKPENVMLDEIGHVKLTDFGLSKTLDEQHDNCGTEEYLPPEVIRHKPFGFEGDWWQLGVLMYELLNRKAPFRGKTAESLYKKILENEPNYGPLPQDTIEVIQALLEKNPQKRVTFHDLQKFSFFSSLSWDDVYNRKVHPHYVPIIKEVGESIDMEYQEVPKSDSFAPPVFTDEGYVNDFSYSGWCDISTPVSCE